MVFVDYQNRELSERPDFFVLTDKDWRTVLERRVNDYKAKNPEQRITITKENVSIFEDQIDHNNRPYKGIDIRAKDLTKYKESWDKIKQILIAG